MGRSARTAEGMVPGGGGRGDVDPGGWAVDGEGELDDDDDVDGEARLGVNGRGSKKSAVEEGELSSEIT